MTTLGLIYQQDLLATAGGDHEAREKRLRGLATDVALLHPATVAWAIEQLVRLLGDEKLEVRWTALETLGFLGDRVPLAPLINVLSTDSWHMKMAALQALKALKKHPTLEHCTRLFNESDWQLRQALIEALGAARNPLFGSLLVEALADEQSGVQDAAIEALGMLAQDAPVALLLSALSTGAPRVREAAAKSLGRLGQYAPVAELLAALQQRDTCQDAARALGMLGPYTPVSSVIAATGSAFAEVRAGAAEALGSLKNSLAITPLVSLLQDRDVSVRRAAIEAIEKIVEPAVEYWLIDLSGYRRWHARWQWMKRHPALELASILPLAQIVAATDDEDGWICVVALRILGLFGEQAPLEPLLDALRDDDHDIRKEAIRALGLAGTRVPVEIFASALQDEHWEVCEAATETLGALGERAPVAALKSVAEEKHSINIFEAVLRACGMLGQYAPIEVVIEALNDDNYMVINAATRALAEIEPWIDAKHLLSALDKNTKPLLLPAIQVLGALQDQASLDALLSVLQAGHSWDVLETVIQTLAHWGRGMPVEILRDVFYHAEKFCGEATLPDGSSAYYPWAPSVCIAVVEALIQLEEDAPIDILTQAVTNGNEVVRLTALHTVGALSRYLSNEVLFEILEDALEHESFETHLEAVCMLAKRGIKASLKRLKEAVSERDLSAISALKIVGQRSLLQSIVGGKSLVEWLGAALHEARDHSNELFDCWHIIVALGETEDAAAIPPLLGVLEDGGYSRDDYDAATDALGKFITAIPVNWFVEKLQSGDEWITEEALWVLRYWSDDTPVPQAIQEQIPLEPLVTAFYNREEEKTREGATAVLGMIGGRAPVELLLTALGDTSGRVREAAVKALRATYPEVLSSLQAEARAVLEQQQAPGEILGSPLQNFIARMIGEIGLASPPYLQRLQELLFWPHWQVQWQAIESFRRLHRPIPDVAIQQLLYLRQRSPARPVRQAADDTLAELLTLETGIEED